MSSTPSERPDYDPVFLNARREAAVIFVTWLIALCWSVPYCYRYGYGVETEGLQLVWGMPAWLFWGIAAPWIAADLFTTWFCFCFMKDDDLGHDPEEEEEDLAATESRS